MDSKRKYRHSQLITIKDFGGTSLPMYVVDDLDDEQLQEQYTYYMQREDYEYCAALAAEAKLRGLRLTVKI